jgi:tetratricopeptide (TPR) repeat protein/tRNA A-37 threonylcarbamoyl transferase component Bud32
MACPSSDVLEAFARGLGDPTMRAELAAHVRGCATCQAKFLPIALQTSALTQTNLDSPAAKKRRISRDAPVSALDRTDPRVEAVAPDGLEDTHVSGERTSSVVTSSGIQKGDTLDRYVILDRLGAGGMGEVYTAWDPVLDRKVAVKVLKPDFEGSELLLELKERLLREAQALARLSHPNVVTVHDVGLAGDQIFLAMEFAEGQTLKQWLETGSRSWRQVLDVFLAAGEGLAAAHAQGLTHRDFKPDNVILGADGRVRVMDFGLAHAQASKKKDESAPMRRTITAPGAMLGTPAYMSPEALHGRPTDFRSDIFSFCVSLYEGLYGYRPFDGSTPAAIAAEIDQNRVKAPPLSTAVPRRIHALVVKGLRANPGERFQTLRALLVQLGRRKSARERQALLLSVALVAGLAVGLSAWVSYRERARCADVGSRLAAAWNESVRTRAAAAFAATGKPWAQAAWRDADRRLDAWAADWLAHRVGACEAKATGDDERLAAEILCLSRRLDEFEATASLFATADADVVERAVVTAAGLQSPAGCRQVAPPMARLARDESLRPLLAEARVRLAAGKLAGAFSLANDAASRAAASRDRASLAEAKLLCAVARVRMGSPRDADELADEALLVAQAAGEDELVARALVERVGFAALLGAGKEADQLARLARASLDRLGGPPELEASLASNAGVLAHVRGRYPEALESHQRALELRRRLYGEQHPILAKTHSNLGATLRAMGRLDDARAQFAIALSIEEKLLDPSHPAVAETLNNLGNVLEAQDDLPGARTALERALAIKKAATGADSLPYAVTLTNYGVLLLRSGDVGAAIEALERSLAIKERQGEPESLSLAITMTNLAAALRQAGQWKDALKLDDRAFHIRRGKHGPGHPELSINLVGRGQDWWGLKRPVEARADFEAALALREARGVERAEAAGWLAIALEGSRDPRVRPLLDEALATLPASHPLRAQLSVLDARTRLQRR